MSDPLVGYREGINDGNVRRLIWPADRPCPVEVGQRFRLRSCEIEIESVQRRIVKGRAPEWQATFIRHETESVYLLRRTPPTHTGSEQDARLNLSQTERARRDGNYTSSRVAAVPAEPESVGPDWHDRDATARELERQNDRKAAAMEQDRDAHDRAEIQRAKARLTQVATEASRKGRDLTSLLDDVYARLAREERQTRNETEAE